MLPLSYLQEDFLITRVLQALYLLLQAQPQPAVLSHVRIPLVDTVPPRTQNITTLWDLQALRRTLNVPEHHRLPPQSRSGSTTS